MIVPGPGPRSDRSWLCLRQVAVALLAAGTLEAGDLGRAIVETATGERVEGVVTVDKSGLRVTDGAGVVRAIAPEMLRVARLVREGNPVPSTPAAPTASGLRGTYFASPNLDGAFVDRLDPEINFNWGGGDPGVGGGIGNENFSVRWEGWLEAPVTGRLKLTTRSDDGVRLWVDGRPLIDQWRAMPATEHSGEIDLEAGKKYPLRLEYYEGHTEATVSLSWEAQGLGRQIIPARFLRPGRPGGGASSGAVRLLLRGGSVLLGHLVSADKRTVTLGTGDGEIDVPLRGIAMLQFGDLPEDRRVALLEGKPGCLSRDPEFLEGEFLGYGEGRLRFSSILFGLKSVDTGSAIAVVTGKQKVRASPFAVVTSGGGTILANEVSVDGDRLMLLDNSFSRLSLPLAGVEEIRGGAYGK